MSMMIPIQVAEHELQGLLKKLALGDTVTLVGAEGEPLALLVSLKRSEAETQATADWDAQWDELVQQISAAWKDEKSALDTLIEMRR